MHVKAAMPHLFLVIFQDISTELPQNKVVPLKVNSEQRRRSTNDKRLDEDSEDLEGFTLITRGKPKNFIF